VAHSTDATRQVFAPVHWRLVLPPDWLAQALTNNSDFGLALDLGWEVERDLMGATAAEAWNAADPTGLPAAPYEAMAEDPLACGGSGTPIRFSRTCFFDPLTNDPRWHFFFHEMGHNTTIAQMARAIFCQLMCPHPAWLEGEANLFGVYALRVLSQSAALSAATRQSIGVTTQEGFQKNTALFLQRLDDWEHVTGGFDESTAESGLIWNGIQVRFANEFGWDYVPRYTRAWRNEAFIRNLMNVNPGGSTTPRSRMTFAAAALCAAVEQDLRERFKAWRFDIDDALFTTLYDHLKVAMDTPYSTP